MGDRNRKLPALAAVCLAAFIGPAAGAAADAVLVGATAQTEATLTGETDGAALVWGLGPAEDPRIVATAKLGGLELYDLSGRRLGAIPAGEATSVAVASQVPLGGTPRTVVATIDSTGHFLRLYTQAGHSLAEAGARPIELGFAGEGVCLFVHPLDRSLHAFIVGDGGEVDQRLVYMDGEGRLDARPVRRISVPSSLKQCSVDATGRLYASEEAVGIWRFDADPEADVAATVVDTPRLGHLEEEVGGIAVYDDGPQRRLLFASDATAGRINVYDREREGAYLGSFQVTAPGASEPVEEPGLLFATATAVGKDYPAGVLLVGDEDAANTKLVSIAAVIEALGLAPAAAAPETAAPATVAVVRARVETVPARSFGDAADDPAIWAHPDDPAMSLVVATDKKAGLYLYDMQGQVVHFRADGKMNNVDLREGFMLGGAPVVLVAASNRTDDSISLYRLDTANRKLVDVAAGIQATGLADPYGLCMYRSARDGSTYVFINGDDTRMRQWRLVDAGNGRVRAELVRDLAVFESQTEGCVADDATGLLYVNEEDAALWRQSAEPDGGDDRIAVDRVGANPLVRDDLEGIGIYDLGDGRGYIVLSSQGNDTYAVYRREGGQEYLGSFAVVADAASGIDGISETDGLEVTSRNLGPGFEHGAMVAQDGRNVMPVENQNYKYVSWSDIAAALGLETR